MHFRIRVALPSRRGFTLIEVLIAVSLLGLFAGGALWALTQANNYAALSRLYTGAQVAAQNQVDLIMSKGPFNPQKDPPEIPSVLTLSGANPLKETVTIYTEPASQVANPLTVTGERTTTVWTDNPAKTLNGRTLYIYYATVLVQFSYRGTQHQVQLNAMRASDAEGS